MTGWVSSSLELEWEEGVTGFGLGANWVFGRVEGGGEVEVEQGGDKTSALELETPT